MKKFTSGLLQIILLAAAPLVASAAETDLLQWTELPSVPDSLGVAGPFVGVHNDVLIVSGGANFPRPVWEHDKVWRDGIHVLKKVGNRWVWSQRGQLPRPIAYGAAVSTPEGVVCMGGNDAERTFDDVFLMTWDTSTEQVVLAEYPALPKPCAFGAATLIDNVIYLAGGQSESSLDSAMANFWTLDLAKKNRPDEFVWRELPPWPGPSRAFNLTARQHNGTHDCVYVISGRRQAGPDPKSVEFLRDVWEYSPANRKWRQRADAPRCVMAGTAIGGRRHEILVLGGADGSLFFDADRLKDDHPGFPREAIVYHALSDTWTTGGDIPQNQVTTIAVRWHGAIIIASGEVRPRVRSPKVWRVTVADSDQSNRQ